MVIVRQMQAEDIVAVADLTSQLGYPASESETKRRFDFIKDRWDARLLVAQHAERLVVGWIHVQATYLLEANPRAEIRGLVVSEAARGRGAGRALVEGAEDWAVRLGLDVIAVRSNIAREPAKGFYEHLGYAVYKTQNAFRKSLS
jgi:ribosomal protein S18 acetylase RimI-like enzyme